jgi:predicted NBD/HSP70 family sugar kinase
MKTGSVIGVDLGGTKVGIARYSIDSWKQLEQSTIPTHAEEGFPAVYKSVCKHIADFVTPDTRALGFGVAGLVESRTGKLLRAPNIPKSEGQQLQRMLAKMFRLPVTVENDARCFTYAEAMRGAGKGHSVVVGITMGTGVGGGIVVDGKIFHGHHGFAGEIGHALLRPGEPPYPTDDRRGEVEQFLSGTAMGHRCTAAKKPEEYLEGAVCSFLQPQVFREVAWLVASLTSILDPSVIVFGGSTGRALGPHLKEVRSELEQWVLPGLPLPKLTVGTLVDASTLGAALIAAIQRR